MKTYKNTKTGVTLTTASVIKGGDWVEVKAGQAAAQVQPEKPAEKPAEQTEKPQEGEETLPKAPDNVTVAEIKQELDALNVEYDPKAKKDVLYALMMSQSQGE